MDERSWRAKRWRRDAVVSTALNGGAPALLKPDTNLFAADCRQTLSKIYSNQETNELNQHRPIVDTATTRPHGLVQRPPTREKIRSTCPIMTTSAGSPIADNQNSLTAGPRGPVHHYRKDGATRFTPNMPGDHDYEPNAFGGPTQDPSFVEPPQHISGHAARWRRQRRLHPTGQSRPPLRRRRQAASLRQHRRRHAGRSR